MKIKSLVVLIALFTISACSSSVTEEGSLNSKNELSQKRSEWAQFEDSRTKQELSIFDEDSGKL